MARDIALHNALIKIDRLVEKNLTHGPASRTVTWAMIKRTIPCQDEVSRTLRGFPDAE